MTAAIASRTVYFRRWRFFSQDDAPGREMSVREPTKTGREAKTREIQPKNGPSREKWRRGAFSAGRDSPPLAHRHRPHPGSVGAGPVQNLGQNLGSEVDRLVREVEATPVHGDHRPRAQVEEGAVGLLGIGVLGAHEPAGLVG